MFYKMASDSSPSWLEIALSPPCQVQMLLKPDCPLQGPAHSRARLFILVRTRRDKINSCWALKFHGGQHGIGIDL